MTDALVDTVLAELETAMNARRQVIERSERELRALEAAARLLRGERVVNPVSSLSPYECLRQRRAQVLGALPARGSVRVAELAAKLRLPAHRVQDDLSRLVAQGVAERADWGCYRRAALPQEAHGGPHAVGA